MESSPSILFMGTPQFAATALAKLIDAGFNVVGVVARADEKSGRGGAMTSPATKLMAEKHKIPVFQPANKVELTKIVEKIKPELIVVAAYGMIIPQAVLDIPKYGALNIHGSLLPKYRGASPITDALLNGDHETGITIMKMSAGMDEGDVISIFRLLISDDDTTETLTRKMADLGAKAIVETIPGWTNGKLKTIPQNNDEATYCHKITKDDGHIDWSKPATQIERMVRAYQPWPTAYTFANDIRIKILKTKEIPGLRPEMTNKIGALHFDNGHIYIPTGEDTLEVLELQPEGKKPMPASAFINGNRALDTTILN